MSVHFQPLYLQVKATLTTCGASFRNAQLQDLPQQVEDALATIATEEAIEFNNFALCYIGALQEAGQVINTSSMKTLHLTVPVQQSDCKSAGSR